MMRVDAHQHFWRLDRGEYPWLTPEEFPAIHRDFLVPDLAPHLKACGIEKTILVQAAETEAETRFLLDLALATPFVGGVVGWTDLAAKDAPARIAALARDPLLKGVRPMLQGLPEDDWILRPDVADGVAAMMAHGLRFDALVFPRHLPVLAKFLARHPDLAVVIDHGAKPHVARGEVAPWKAQMRILARDFPVTCKLSGLATEAAPGWTIDTLRPYVEALIEIFGPARLMWGSDWPVLNMAGDYPNWFNIAQQLTVQLPQADRDAIFGGTAARFYGL
jgi:L-fuconolactonase